MYGIGLGSEFYLKDKLQLNIEASCNQELWIGDSRAGWPLYIDRLNMLNQARVLFNFKPNDQICLFVGPTLNVSVSDASPDVGLIPYYELGPNWAFYDRTGNQGLGKTVKIWMGISGGIRL